MEKCQILLTNDDGILSPGLWAAAEALSTLGYVTVAAPREQSSGTGRSLPNNSDGIIHEEQVKVGGKEWKVYAVGGTPAQAVLHGVLEIMPHKPDLVVSGINYGENLAIGITVSGTVGAAMEAAALGIQALAMSLETDQRDHLSYSKDVDFFTAAHFTAYFARMLIDKCFPAGVDLLKVDVPRDATAQTPWQVTRLARQPYYEPIVSGRKSWLEPGPIGYREAANLGQEPEDSDVYVMRVKRLISVTPLSLDLTAQVNFGDFDRYLRE